MGQLKHCIDCGAEIDALRRRCRECALEAEKQNRRNYLQRRRTRVETVEYFERIDVTGNKAQIITIKEERSLMAFQVNPKDPNFTEEEWNVGVAAYEAGEDPEVAVARYRGEKAAEFTASLENEPKAATPAVKKGKAKAAVEVVEEANEDPDLSSPAQSTSIPAVIN